MAGKKGQKAWNKRDEYEWRDLWSLSKTDLMDLAGYFKRQIKKYKDFETAYAGDENFRKLYNKWLEISTTVFVKGIPQKIEADGFQEHKHFTIVFPPGVKIDGPNGRNGVEAVLPEEIPS